MKWPDGSSKCCRILACSLFFFLSWWNVSAQSGNLVVETIFFEGLEKTKQRVLFRELDFAVGDTIKLNQLDRRMEVNQQNLYNLGLFNTVDVIPTVSQDSTELGVIIAVKERWYIFPIPFAQLQERTFNEWWADKDLDRLVVGLWLKWDNLTGRNDDADAKGSIGYTNELYLSYDKPFLFPKKRIDGLFEGFYVANKEVGYATQDGKLQLARLENGRIQEQYGGEFSLRKRITQRMRVSAGVRYERFKPDDSLLVLNERYLASGKGEEYYPSLKLRFVNDQRDFVDFPLDGYKYEATAQYSGPLGLGTSSFFKASASFSHHIPLSKRWNFAYGTQTFISAGKRIPYFDKHLIGFTNELRGYEPYVIDGTFINLTKAEWKFAPLPRRMFHMKRIPFRKFRDFPLGIYVSAYGDVGYVYDGSFNNLDPTLKDRLLVGYGIGLNIITMYDSFIRIEYSGNHMREFGLYLHGTVSIR